VGQLGGSGSSFYKDIYVQGRYAYIVSDEGFVGSTRLRIVDISNPSSPTNIVSLNDSVVDASSVYVQGRYLYLTDTTLNVLVVYDVSNPASPISVGSVSTATNPDSVYVQDRYAYITNKSSSNFQIFDVSNPSSLTLVGTVATGTRPEALYVQGRYAYVVNYTSNTLQIFDVGGSYIQQFEAGGAEIGTLQIRNNLIVNNDLDIRGGATFTNGFSAVRDSSVYGSFGVISQPKTLISSATAEYTTGTFTAPTITLTGTTNITSQMDSFLFNAPTLTNASAMTVAGAATMTIAGAPIRAGSANLTNTYGLKINAGAVSTATNSFGLFVDAQTGATNNYAAVFNTGNVGIGTATPGYKLTVNGEPAANGYTQFTNYSDQRLKENIQPLQDGYLAKIMQLNPSSFNYNELSGYDAETRSRTIRGFIAQEIQEVFPEMVGQVQINGTDYLDTNLSSLPIYLTRAMQEQQIQIEDVTLKTDSNITSVTELQNSIDQQLGIVETTLTTFDTRLSTQETTDASQDSLIATLQSQIATLQSQIATPVNVAQIDANSADISYLKTILGIDPANPGNISLTGILSAEGLETGKLTIKVSDTAAATIGTAEITPVLTDTDNDGLDDNTGSDGKSIRIMTTAVNGDSRIFVTLKNVMDEPLAVVNIDDGQGFEVKIKTAVVEDVRFDWWIVEEK